MSLTYATPYLITLFFAVCPLHAFDLSAQTNTIEVVLAEKFEEVKEVGIESCNGELDTTLSAQKGFSYWTINRAQPNLLRIVVNKQAFLFWSNPHDTVKIEIRRKGEAIGFNLKRADARRQMLLIELVDTFPEVNVQPMKGPMFDPELDCEAEVARMIQRQQQLEQYYEKHLRDKFTATENRELYYWISFASLAYWEAQMQCTIKFMQLQKQNGTQLYPLLRQVFLSEQKLAYLTKDNEAYHYPAVHLALFKLFQTTSHPTNELSNIDTIKTWLDGTLEIDAIGSFLARKCKKSFEDSTLVRAVKDFIRHCPDTALINELEFKCRLCPHPYLNKPFQWSFADTAGQIIDLPKGKVIFLDIWTTWCGPCKKEAKHLPALLERFAGEDFEVVALSFDTNLDKWKSYVRKSGDAYQHLHIAQSREGMKKALQVDSYPRYLLIDKEGRLVDVLAPRPSEQADLDAAIKALL